jgi:periplasmic protein TonB
VNARIAMAPITTEHPLRAVQRMGTRASRDGLYLGIIGAIVFHFTALESPRYSHIEMRLAIQEMHLAVRDHLRGSYYDVDLVEPKPTEPEEKAEPEPEPEIAEPEIAEPEVAEVIERVDPREPPAEAAEPADDDIYEEIPPAAAEAPDVMTHDGPVKDLTGFTMTDKDGSRSSGGGYTSAKGTAKQPVRDPRAKASGQGKGKGDGKVHQSAKRKADLSRAVTPTAGSWNCPFPPQADLEQIDRASALVAVTVDPSGRATSVSVVNDPGYGFGSQAKACALPRRYLPALDRDGRAITATASIRVHFTR